jgi:hypothetical protein
MADSEKSKYSKTSSGKKPEYSKTKASSPEGPSPLSSPIPVKSSIKAESYTGNPTQSHMASSTSDPRHHVLTAYNFPATGGGMRTQVQINAKPNQSPIFDEIILVEDTTGDGNLPTLSTYLPPNLVLLEYSTSSPVSTAPHAAYRTYEVTWQSGFVKTFSLLLPGTQNAISLTGSGSIGFGFFAHPCSTGYQWEASLHKSNTTLDWNSYTKTNVISNPSGVYFNGEAFRSTGNSIRLDNSGRSASGWIQKGANKAMANAQSLSSYLAVPDPSTTPEQSFETFKVALNTVNYANSVSQIQNNLGNAYTWSDIAQKLQDGTWEVPFMHTIVYSENLYDCNNTTYTIDGCTNPDNMAFYEYTGEDCAGTAIPSAVVADPSIAAWTPGSCCPDCINPDGDDITLSTQSLTLNVQGTDPTTIGGTDGYVDVTIVDGGFDANGQPQGLPTGVANYTYVIQNTDAADTMCGNTAGLGVGSGAVANTSFTFGNSVIANTNGGLLQTGATGTATYAASAAQGYVPGGTSTSAPYGLGTTNSEGFREGTYKVYVFDASTTVCLGQTQVTLTDPLPTTGCGDSDALNYDNTVTLPINTTCHYCDELNGELVEGQVTPSIVGPITSSSGTVASIVPPTNTTATDSEITTTGISPSSIFQAYINNIVSGSTQNADYIVELYKWDSQTSTGNANFGTLSGFNAGTTIVGTAVNNQGAGWNGVTFTGFTYGYYSIKVYISDPDATVEIEQCYEIFDILNPVAACVDGGVATAIDSVIVSDSNLYFHDPAICSLLPSPCCDSVTFGISAASTTCAIEYETTINCNSDVPTSQNVELQWWDGGAYVTVNSSGAAQWINNPGSSTTVTFAQSVFELHGSGEYRVTFVSEFSGFPDCTLTTRGIQVTLGIWGCMDPNSSNYDALATCDSGCTYCVWGCMDPSADNYDANATCNDGSCTYAIPGCTDITATNYDPYATLDDGSCQYMNCGCTDPLAYNYGYNILGQLVGTPPSCDDGNCQYCEDPAMDVSFTTTGTTLVSSDGCLDNCDGSIELTVTSATGCTHYTIVSMYSFCGIVNSNIYVMSNQDFTTGTNTLSNLCSAMYTFILEDCNGCQMQVDISVPGAGAPCGCTDPAADNYCASCTTDDGSCEYCGCTDDGAINYNPEATANCDPDTCEYPPMLPPCIPPTIDQTLYQIQACIAENGFDYYNKVLIGKTDDCSIMNVWKLILIDYLLKKKGLECIYNCADANTPDAADVYVSCWGLWRIGGTTTGYGDPVQTAANAANGTKHGTTSTAAMFDISSTTELYPGDVIRHHNSGNIWIFYGPGQGSNATGVSVAGLDPENASGNASGYWGYCNDNMRYISNTNNINYIDNFITFVNTFCADCKNDMAGIGQGLTKYEIDSMFGKLSNSDGIDEVEGIDI